MNDSTHTSYDQPPWLTIGQTAEVLVVSKSTVRDLLKRGQLPSRRIGKQIRIPRLAVMPQELTTAS